MNSRRFAVSLALALSILGASAIANADSPSRVTLLREAEADVDAGRIVDAMRTTAKVVDEMPLANADREERAAFQRGLDLMAHLRSRVSHLTIAVAGAPASEIAIEVDGVLVTGNANDVLVDPGEHFILAKAANRDTAFATVRVRAGESKGVPLVLGARIAPVVTSREASSVVRIAPTMTTTTTTTTSTTDLLRPAAYATLTAGVGALVVGVGTGLLARDRIEQVKERCPNNMCPAEMVEDVDRARTYSNISTGAFVISGIALATSAILFIAAPKSAPSVTATANGLGGRF